MRTVSKPKVINVLISNAYKPPSLACVVNGAAYEIEAVTSMSNILATMDKAVLNMI